MPRLPSLSYIASHARAAFHRFPYVLFCGGLSAFLSILLIENESSDFWFTKLFMTCGLGIPLFFSLTLYLEKPLRGLRPHPLALLGGGVALLTGFYFLSGGAATENFYLNYAQWALAFHLLASFSPFLAKGEVNGFWQFNRRLFLRFCLSALYAGVFYLGLVLALAAVDHLLGVKVHDKLYFDLWVFSVFVLQTWHFLAGVPADLKGLEKDEGYPGGLKVFAQYLLVPLVALYLAILYAYAGKVVLQWNWPKGTVTWLVSFVSVFGVFTLLLLHPVRERKENGWIGAATRGFYFALFPLLAMLFTAVGKRVDQYGFTEQRYFVAVLGVWILVLSVYFLARRHPNIKVVPMTLFLVTLLTSTGPWGAYSVSCHSQLGRLKALLSANGLWDGHQGVKAAKDVPYAARREICSILDYLVENHGVEPLKGWFKVDLSPWADDAYRGRYGYSNLTGQICKSLGFDYTSRWDENSGKYFSYYVSDNSVPLSIKGYDELIRVSGINKFNLEDQAFIWRKTEGQLDLLTPGGGKLSFDLAGLVERLEKNPKEYVDQRTVPQGLLVLEASNGLYEGKLYLEGISGRKKDKGMDIDYPSGYLLLRKK